jgi:hypothetical protein
VTRGPCSGWSCSCSCSWCRLTVWRLSCSCRWVSGGVAVGGRDATVCARAIVSDPPPWPPSRPTRATVAGHCRAGARAVRPRRAHPAGRSGRYSRARAGAGRRPRPEPAPPSRAKSPSPSASVGQPPGIGAPAAPPRYPGRGTARRVDTRPRTLPTVPDDQPSIAAPVRPAVAPRPRLAVLQRWPLDGGQPAIAVSPLQSPQGRQGPSPFPTGPLAVADEHGQDHEHHDAPAAAPPPRPAPRRTSDRGHASHTRTIRQPTAGQCPIGAPSTAMLGPRPLFAHAKQLSRIPTRAVGKSAGYRLAAPRRPPARRSDRR